MSAAIVKHWFNTTYSCIKGNGILDTTATGDTLEFIGYNYGQPIPDLSEYDKVIMCDISFPFDDMKKIASSSHLIWLDHHKSAIEHITEECIKINYRFDGIYGVILGLSNEDIYKYAACELTWKYFFPDREMPEAVRLLGRYDVWDHADSNVLPFQMGIRLENTWPDNQNMWQDYFSKYSDDLIKDTINEGKRFSSIKNRRMKNMLKVVLWKLNSKDLKLLLLINF